MKNINKFFLTITLLSLFVFLALPIKTFAECYLYSGAKSYTGQPDTRPYFGTAVFNNEGLNPEKILMPYDMTPWAAHLFPPAVSKDGKHIYYIVTRNDTGGYYDSQIVASHDSGKTWQTVMNQAYDSAYIHCTDDGKNIIIFKRTARMLSNDYGATWKSSSSVGQDALEGSFAYYPRFVSTSDNYVYISLTSWWAKEPLHPYIYKYSMNNIDDASAIYLSWLKGIVNNSSELPGNAALVSTAVSADDKTIYLNIYNEFFNPPSNSNLNLNGVYKSDNGGANFIKLKNVPAMVTITSQPNPGYTINYYGFPITDKTGKNLFLLPEAGLTNTFAWSTYPFHIFTPYNIQQYANTNPKIIYSNDYGTSFNSKNLDDMLYKYVSTSNDGSNLYLFYNNNSIKQLVKYSKNLTQQDSVTFTNPFLCSPATGCDDMLTPHVVAGFVLDNAACKPSSDFVLSPPQPSPQSAARGDTKNYSFSITSVNNFNGTVHLSSTDSAVGTTIEFYNSANNKVEDIAINSGESVTITMKVKAESNATSGNHNLTIIGSNGAKTHSVSAQLKVAQFSIIGDTYAKLNIGNLSMDSGSVATAGGTVNISGTNYKVAGYVLQSWDTVSKKMNQSIKNLNAERGTNFTGGTTISGMFNLDSSVSNGDGVRSPGLYPDGKIWSKSGNLIINTTQFNGKGTIIVDGDVNIIGNVTYGSDSKSSLGIVANNITISSSASNLVGSYYASRNITINAPTTPGIYNVIMAANKIIFAGGVPDLSIRYNQNQSNNPPPGFQNLIMPTYSEVSP